MKEISLIIPMAGMGTRLRPQTLLTPKPMFPIAGKPIVAHLVSFLANNLPEDLRISEINFIIGPHFGEKIEAQLREVASQLGIHGNILYQEEALGTAHAVYCAEKSLQGNVLIAFADTLFIADLKQIGKANNDGIIWTKRVEDPRQFGVVITNSEGYIVDMEEKPEDPKSDLAIIGVYYIKEGEALKKEIEFLLKNDLKSKGEYQLTDALFNLIKKGKKLIPGEVLRWMDCGNRDAVLDTMKEWLELFHSSSEISETANTENSVLIPPVYLGEGVQIKNSVIGPYVSVEQKAVIENSVLRESIVKAEAKINGVNLQRSILGEKSEINRSAETFDISDFSRIY